MGGCLVPVIVQGKISQKKGAGTMNTESILKCAAYLSPQQRKIIDLVTVGNSPEQIAGQLHVSERAVLCHVQRIAAKIREVVSNV